ncbi:MAG: YhgE/Pip domain-containing protein [Collinsella sp.]
MANEDAGAGPETGHLDVGGAQVVAPVARPRRKMGCGSCTDARSGRKTRRSLTGRYWAALVIPKDFSADFASVFTGDFTQPTIDYYVNEKPSSIAPKVTDAAANAVEAAVNENFVKTVSEKVVETTQKVGAEAQTKADAAEGSLTAGVRSAKEAVSETRTTAEGLVGTAVGDTRTSIARADDTLAGLQRRRARICWWPSGSRRSCWRRRAEHREREVRDGAFQERATDGRCLVVERRAAQAAARLPAP